MNILLLRDHNYRAQIFLLELVKTLIMLAIKATTYTVEFLFFGKFQCFVLVQNFWIMVPSYNCFEH